MENEIEKKVNMIVRDWFKKGFIKKSKMIEYIGTTIPMLTKIGINTKNGKCVAVVADYVCYLLELNPNPTNILADLKTNDKTLYNEVIGLFSLKDLVKFTNSDAELLKSKNLEKVQKSLKTKLNKQIDVAIQEVKDKEVN